MPRDHHSATIQGRLQVEAGVDEHLLVPTYAKAPGAANTEGLTKPPQISQTIRTGGARLPGRALQRGASPWTLLPRTPCREAQSRAGPPPLSPESPVSTDLWSVRTPN
ncbi:hypothetical protein GCM10010430_35040 [Kitasatospora cystarginea]|uniref:Uncharacterized protein n=1 Tax=Kitasatospora cystarginea TaxID=58350 RepID=A0ABN3E6N9_9ACTN